MWYLLVLVLILWILNSLASFFSPASWISQQWISSWLTRYIDPLFSSANVFGVSAKSMQCSHDDKGNSVPTILLMMQKRLYIEGGLKVCLCSYFASKEIYLQSAAYHFYIKKKKLVSVLLLVTPVQNWGFSLLCLLPRQKGFSE